MNWIYLLLIISAIASDAVSDAILDNTRKRNHYLEVATITSFLLIILLKDYYFIHWSNILIGYVLIRIGIFNIIYNHVRGIDNLYLGNTDKIFDKHLKRLPSWLYATLILICLFLGVSYVLIGPELLGFNY